MLCSASQGETGDIWDPEKSCEGRTSCEDETGDIWDREKRCEDSPPALRERPPGPQVVGPPTAEGDHMMSASPSRAAAGPPAGAGLGGAAD